MADGSSFIFITGGVRSGKSSFAEKLAIDLADQYGARLTLLATGVPSDLEMQERITKHKRDRETGNHIWRTLERSVQIGKEADRIDNHDIVLMDCITTLLNNELFLKKRDWDETFLKRIQEDIVSGILEIKNRAHTMIVVSNEVLCEPQNDNNLVLTYSRLLGTIHQCLVSQADQAFLVEAGIPIRMKGELR
ncbi:bifunctional adenosylcobinamide kinase/adenosylcobinamide-phosphate guanylyltransferase [Bacillus sp. BRMEA1]|uniref:bifunctional adenosylcobinamide kinase/adenosylcobinamide-phosphate guanylyltransferase n=1 Tax=Neobacillus endophyticus TaxID=2738405 RepID=UPI0015631528|nr:bifunctional adenosylcobinamide kinase/adenosylcobinamide-phosphate guanylyltransferase [Neobacillus endophyticus]NRD79317.1 bifunctional adenosylcobinamide kinase/adenosylcobinamide-phosphate guanylyltransferase [Neobacillus endophyticus]